MTIRRASSRPQIRLKLAENAPPVQGEGVHSPLGADCMREFDSEDINYPLAAGASQQLASPTPGKRARRNLLLRDRLADSTATPTPR